MKRNRDRPFAMVAVALALVAGTYMVPGTVICRYADYTDVCRNILNPPPDETVVIGTETCTIDSDSYNDQMVGRSFHDTWDSSAYCIGSTTYCGVAYDCPLSGLQLVDYLLPQDGLGWFEIFHAPPFGCTYCPDRFP